MSATTDADEQYRQPHPLPTGFMLVPIDWEARMAALIERELTRQAQRQEAAHRLLTAQEAASRWCGGSLTRWRNLRWSYPVIDERASVGGVGRLRRWDAVRLGEVVAELGPATRRRRQAAA